MTKSRDTINELRIIGLSAGVFTAGSLMFAFTSAAVWEKSAHFYLHGRTRNDIG